MESEVWVVSSPKLTLRQSFLDLWTYRAILGALIKRDLKSRYRTSFFGFAWAFAKPLMQLVVYTLVIGSILGAARSIPNFAIFIFAGLMFWNFFIESITVGTFSIVAGSGLVTKVAFPREILPLSAVLIAGINLLIQFPVLIVGYLVTNSKPDFGQIWNFLPLVISLFVISLSGALVLSALNVYARDIQPLTEMVLTLLMYLSPVIYSWTFVRDAAIAKFGNDQIFKIYELNPLTQIISGVQDFFWHGVRKFSDGSVAPGFMGATTPSLWAGVGISLIVFLLSYKLFLRLEPNFAREL